MVFNGTYCNLPSSNAACGTGCTSCSVSGNITTCSLCMSGWVLNFGSCVPCQSGCQICSNSNFGICVTCLPGFYVNSTGGCTACTQFCAVCSAVGCTACQQGYQLTSNFTCTFPCRSPCASCMPGNPSICLTCAYGYLPSTASLQGCVPNLGCNNASLSNCAYCPYGYAMINSNTNTNINQTCVACSSNCTRCLNNNPTTCTACTPGYYLNSNSSCVACIGGCVSCTSPSICLACGYGYIL